MFYAFRLLNNVTLKRNHKYVTYPQLTIKITVDYLNNSGHKLILLGVFYTAIKKTVTKKMLLFSNFVFGWLKFLEYKILEIMAYKFINVFMTECSFMYIKKYKKHTANLSVCIVVFT